MSTYPRRDTRPELALRSALHARGFRFRVQLPIPSNRRRRIDVAFTRLRVAVFVDGCFWHGCPEHGTRPVANREWWDWKIARNQARDRDTDRLLDDLGWRVVRVWEHVPVPDAVELVAIAVQSRRAEIGAVGGRR
jgi:DNA mismatch endonuclease, patch repair protein